MLSAPTGWLRAMSGVERMALIPSFFALGTNAGHRVSWSKDSTWNQCPLTEASTHGPSPVAYWSASMSEIVWSLAATVARRP